MDDLTQRLQRCQRALEASGDGFWERDLRTETIWYSPGFLALFGFAEGDLASERGVASARVHPEDRLRFRSAYRQALRSCGRFDYEVRFLDAQGQWRWVLGRGRVWADPRSDGSARPVFITGSVSDVHHRTTALHELQQHRRTLEALVRERTAGLEAALVLAEERRQEAERANAAKSRFLAQMSHEIRTPLNGVLGLTELALRDARSDDQRRFLTVAHQSGQALLQVITDVLDFSRIESDRVELRERAFDPAQLLAEAMRAVMPLARRRELPLLYDWLGPNQPLLGAEGAIRQIVTNLLGNAIKFIEEHPPAPALPSEGVEPGGQVASAQDGQVSLVAEARPTGDGRMALTIEVADTGPGVPEAMRARVFEAFEQGDVSLARRHGGTGLGLTIAQRLASALGGSLQLACPPEGGSRFTLALVLPIAPGPAPVQAPVAPGRHAWVVYHQHKPGQWLARRMARLGWTTEVFVGLPATLARARQPVGPTPDQVLLAEPVLPPGTDLTMLRGLLPAAAMHLVIRPDWHDPVLAQQARALQISTVVAPLTPDLLARLAGLPARAAADVPAPGPTPLRADTEVLLVEDNPVNQLVGEACLKALGLQVRVAGGGSEALDVCTRHPPALVLMDLQMPGMDGLETTARLLALQREGRWPGAPILALTAHASDADRAACQAAGMRAVLTKPLSLASLREQLAPWLSV